MNNVLSLRTTTFLRIIGIYDTWSLTYYSVHYHYEYVNLTFIISLTYLPMKTYTIIDRVKYWYAELVYVCKVCMCGQCMHDHTCTIRKTSYIYNNNNNKIMIHIDRTFMDTRHNNKKYLTELTYKHVIFSSSSIINY